MGKDRCRTSSASLSPFKSKWIFSLLSAYISLIRDLEPFLLFHFLSQFYTFSRRTSFRCFQNLFRHNNSFFAIFFHKIFCSDIFLLPCAGSGLPSLHVDYWCISPSCLVLAVVHYLFIKFAYKCSLVTANCQDPPE